MIYNFDITINAANGSEATQIMTALIKLHNNLTADVLIKVADAAATKPKLVKQALKFL